MGLINGTEDVNGLEEDLDKLNESEMAFNIDKCQIMHFGQGNMKANYTLGGKILNKGDSVNDLGITISNGFKFSRHYSAMVKKANQMLGFIRASISSRNRAVILPLYKSLVRPHLEYAVQFWSPHFRKDINNIEKVQRRATKLIDTLASRTYEDRLRHLNLYSLEKHRRRGDLTQAFKIIKGIDSIGNLWAFSTDNRTRGHDLKLVKTQD